ncbi:MAG: hypothetical protein PHE68_04845 [Candidatus Peribacteraceae bacterium]|nr:hypothetical protein [Candidatus Peribacteraceae bacterium]MDD5074791.1 hypothetical protein [Candidatus Peribacteraceae bacterium]
MDLAALTTRVVPLAELSQWSPWPSRLLGLSEWQTPHRDTEKVDNEYDKDKYARCLAFLKEHEGAVTPKDVRAFELHIDPLKSTCVSNKGVLYEMPQNKIMLTNANLLQETMDPLMKEANIVVELGCGYGYPLWILRQNFPKKKFIGGELSKNAVEIARILYADDPMITVEHCNLYDHSYGPLEQCPRDAKVIVFTRHAIEQLPSAAVFLKTLTQYFDRLVAVVHLEVIPEYDEHSLLDLMRQRYMIMNDYNHDLLKLLRERNDIETMKISYDEVGQNPLNPTSVIVWKPRRTS